MGTLGASRSARHLDRASPLEAQRSASARPSKQMIHGSSATVPAAAEAMAGREALPQEEMGIIICEHVGRLLAAGAFSLHEHERRLAQCETRDAGGGHAGR